MTKQESFKRRVRDRMAKTGERYGAARRVLIEQAKARASAGTRHWVSQPEVADERLVAATGQGWDAWCDLIEAWPGRDTGHTAVASWLRDAQGLDEWWAQSVTGGWERITGRRLPGEMPDGTFTANKSRTVVADASLLRELLIDEQGQADLFPAQVTELRSKPSARTLRIAFGAGASGIAKIALTEKPDGRVTVGVQHTKLTSPEAVDEWKFYWTDWLDAISD